MNKGDIKQLIDKFGMIKTSGPFAKTIYGVIKEHDSIGNVWFVDNDDIGHVFKLKNIDSFKEVKFKSK